MTTDVSRGDELFDCGTHTIHEHLLATDAHYRHARANVSAILDQISPSTNRFTGGIRVPVVVHVIWNTDEQKLTMEQVNSQIGALNRDFNLQNKDIEDVPLPWKGRTGNPNITFFLTRRDPQGKPHQGVNWIQTDTSQFDGDDSKMKFSPQGSPAWDRDRFLNVWVCNMTKNLGFAYYPGAAIDKGLDGVVIQYTAFGTIQPEGKRLSPLYNLGRTLVHEVGHYLNLPHVFDKEASVVNDTTNLPGSAANFSKPLYPKATRLADGRTNAKEGGDMFMNYMDYSDDDVTIMFTQAQVSRMRTALTTLRSTVFWSNFSLQLRNQATSFELADKKSNFTILDWYNNGKPTLAAIKSSTTQPKSTEIHYTNSTGDLASKPAIIQVNGLGDSVENYSFALGRWQKNDDKPSLFAFKQSKTEKKFVELRVYPSGSDVKKFDTVLPETDSSWSFLLANWNPKEAQGPPDVIAVKKSKTTNKKIEVHVLSAKSGYTKWLAHKYTALDESLDPVVFLLTDWNGDGTLDLVAVRKASDGAAFAVDILAGAAEYRDFLVRTEIKDATLNTKVDYDFAMNDMTGDGRPDLVAIQKSGVVKVGNDTPKAQIIVLAG